ncbi:DUF2064 domain-containing protein [Rhodococcus sp. X156]|uniref:TIGR04282 family arsenosugar biosynthesis glycosyltransferase n=1 Tax=Rhodococcus sp. X156 TaxID=2499145 RepID=UPI000FD6DCC6|nr:DUF2064 domain-containing protein [Rhodococcus sp. X156]
MSTLLVVAKAPVPGRAKTRLSPWVAPEEAADLAAAALLDTLAAVAATPAACHVVALAGELHQACRSAEIGHALCDFVVLPQRGPSFAARLCAAHTDAAAAGPGTGVLQIGMDTPQVTPALLGAALAVLREADAALGLATDGGWWALGVGRPALAQCLAGVPMSQPDTGARTAAALRAAGAPARSLPELRDVDRPADVLAVAELAPDTLFAAAARCHQQREAGR